MTGSAPQARLPADVAARVVALLGGAGAEWLEQLPQRIDDVVELWRLAQLGEPFARAQASFVAPARTHDGRSVVLKLAPRPQWLEHEAAALDHWAGRGAVRLEAVDLERGALLLQRAEPGRPLAQLVAGDDRAATRAAAGVLSALRASHAPAPPDMPAIESWITMLEPSVGDACSRELADARRAALPLARALLAAAQPRVLLHGDLHHENVLLAGGERWLAIDPKGVVGPAEAETAALLRNPRSFLLAHADPSALIRDRIAILAERLGYDRERIAGWGYVGAVIAAAWAYEDGDDDDARRWLPCAAFIRAAGRTTAA